MKAVYQLVLLMCIEGLVAQHMVRAVSEDPTMLKLPHRASMQEAGHASNLMQCHAKASQKIWYEAELFNAFLSCDRGR